MSDPPSPGDVGVEVDYALAAARRRQLIDCYCRVRSAADPRVAWEMWRGEMALLRTPVGGSPAALPAFAYEPAWRCTGAFVPSAPLLVAADPVTVVRIGVVMLDLAVAEPVAEPVALEMYWVAGYPGGMLLPFADPTNGESTAVGGRLLIDQAAGADLGGEGDRWVIDFNFAYDATVAGTSPTPSVTSANRVPVPVTAGERLR